MAPLIIEARDGSLYRGRYAIVTPGDDGTDFTIWERVGRANGRQVDGSVHKLISTGTLPVPFHVACDTIHDLIDAA